jgi:hypothetical protein
MSHNIAEIRERELTLEQTEDILSVGKLSIAQFASSARATMLTQHLPQAAVPNNPEIPATYTGHENMFGHYSCTYHETESKLEVVKKILKYKFSDFNYVLVTYDPKKKVYDVIERREVKNMAESFGFRYNNTGIDKYRDGDIIPKNKMLFKSPTLDDHKNFMYGLQANVAYLIAQDTIEDAVAVTDVYAERASITKVTSCRIPMNDNDIWLDICGDGKVYKSFANIGEWTKDSVIAASRRKDKRTAQHSMKNYNLRKIFHDDDLYQELGDWQIVDVDIWCNKTLDEIPDDQSHAQIKSYYASLLEYHQELFDLLGDIIDNADEKGHTYSTALSRMYAEARDVLDPNCKWTDNGRMFSNMIVEFTYAKSEPLRAGSKITGRFGNKSVISRVITQAEMGYTETGIPIDIRIDALGVIGRLNSGQSIEVELNRAAVAVKMTLSSMTDNNARIKILSRFLTIANKKYADIVMANYNSYTTEDERNAFFNDIIEDRIYIWQEPLHAITGDRLKHLYEEFKPQPYTITVKDEDGEFKVRRQCIVGEEYILILKQLAISKFSVRSKGLINPRTSLPSKSLRYQKKKSLFADQAIRFGEQELGVLQLSNNMEALDYFYRFYASSVTARRDDSLYTSDPLEGYTIDSVKTNSRMVDILNAFLKSMGFKILIDVDENLGEEPVETFEAETMNLPDYIKDLFKD